MTRGETLDKAKDIVLGDRQTQYGRPEDVFADIARMWSVYLGMGIEPADVAILMILLKTARSRNSGHQHLDSWVDIAGYAACGAELATEEREEPFT